MQPKNQQSGQQEHPARIRPVRLVKHAHAFNKVKQWQTLPTTDDQDAATEITEKRAAIDITRQPTKRLSYLPGQPSQSIFPITPILDVDMSDEEIDISRLRTGDLMQLSGMLQAIKVQKQKTGKLPPITDIHNSQTFGRIPIPLTPIPPVPETEPITEGTSSVKPRWRAFLDSSVVRVIFGLAIGIGLLFLISKVVDIPTTLSILRQHLTTPSGILLAILCGLSFIAAYSIRGIRWKLFLNPIGKVSTLKAIQLFWVGVFFNFILPVRGGEIAKSLMLKRVAGIPVSQSLPTVAMDKALDLMPVLIIIALVPILGVQMDIKLWLVLGAVGSILIGMIVFIMLAAWKRNAAINLLQNMTRLLPKFLASKIEGFATGFVDSLLAGASQPRIFLPAVLLTILAVFCDGLFAMLAFWTIGSSIPFGTAIFGYTVYITFYILPTTPGEVGTNEAVGLLVFSGLLHQIPTQVNAMFFFSHPYTAIIMCTLGLICLSALGLTINGAIKARKE
jgi:uncharacterized protein (TIRG00374 family)